MIKRGRSSFAHGEVKAGEPHPAHCPATERVYRLFSAYVFFFFFHSFFGLGQGAEIKIELSDADKRKKVDVKNEEGKKEKLPLYYDGESVSGRVREVCYNST